MKQSNRLTNETRTGWILLIFGIVLLAAGAISRQLMPNVTFLGRLVMALGIFFTGWGIITLNKWLVGLKDPQAARRMVVEEQDERSLSIRDRAGNRAFIFSILASSFGLIIYSALTSNQAGFDPIWWYLAFTVVGPGLFYTLSLISMYSKY